MSKAQELVIQAPKFQVIEFNIRGTAPYVQNKFSAKARETMRAAQEKGNAGKKGTKKDPKDFQACYEGAMHRLPDGGHGIPAPAFRSAMISACRACGYKMTHAKLGVFVEADGYDSDCGTPLVRITKGQPEYHEALVRQQTTTDIRPRPMWREGWEAIVRVRFDADMFSPQDVSNLMMRVGQQVGIGEGRPDSRMSAGMGWGLFAFAD